MVITVLFSRVLDAHRHSRQFEFMISAQLGSWHCQPIVRTMVTCVLAAAAAVALDPAGCHHGAANVTQRHDASRVTANTCGCLSRVQLQQA
jgi:hypothetical protein